MAGIEGRDGFSGVDDTTCVGRRDGVEGPAMGSSMSIDRARGSSECKVDPLMRSFIGALEDFFGFFPDAGVMGPMGASSLTFFGALAFATTSASVPFALPFPFVDFVAVSSIDVSPTAAFAFLSFNSVGVDEPATLLLEGVDKEPRDSFNLIPDGFDPDESVILTSARGAGRCWPSDTVASQDEGCEDWQVDVRCGGESAVSTNQFWRGRKLQGFLEKGGSFKS